MSHLILGENNFIFKNPSPVQSAVSRLEVVRNVKMLDLVTLRVSEDSLLHETSAHLKHDRNLNYFKNGGGQ